jgi:cobalt-zinc-cadmium efflux system membrane fusion protein
MNCKIFLVAALCLALCVLLAGCGAKGNTDPAAGAPPPTVVEQEEDVSVVKVAHPEQFPLAPAVEHRAAPELNVTGVVNPDVSRTVPVVSLASGRVAEIHARLGDAVVKGQLLLRVLSADISGAFSDYRKAVADQTLANAQLERARLLYSKGAMAQKDLEVAQDTENKATVDVETAAERIRLLGADVSHPTSLVDIRAPVSGVITEQNVTAAAGVKTLDNSPNLFTIADLSRVWVLCDVYENDMANVRLGEFAEVRLNAYPGKVFQARISNIGPALDPSIRTAKVRLELQNPRLMRIGMFVTATFHGQSAEVRAAIPADAVLHLHDRDWVYVPQGGDMFRRVEVRSGGMVAPGRQEILSGIRPGEQVIKDALNLQSTEDY